MTYRLAYGIADIAYRHPELTIEVLTLPPTPSMTGPYDIVDDVGNATILHAWDDLEERCRSEAHGRWVSLVVGLSTVEA